MTDTTTEALELAAIGLRVFPVRENDKRPAINGWPAAATSEPPDYWFNGKNIGVRCGATDLAGVWFFVVDIDIKDDQPGAESWATFCNEHPEVRDVAAATVMSHTPSGGWHFWFVVPDGVDCPTNGRPWPGVDIRGEGGYVLAPPSALPNGEYTWVRDPWENEVLEAPMALIEALTRSVEPEVPRSVLQVSSIVGDVSRETSDESPFDWINRNFDSYGAALRQGWRPGRRRGGEEQMVRPGKDGRDGTSATFHHDTGIMNIYSTSVDPMYAQVGKHNRDGSILMTPADWWMLENGITDRSEASRQIRAQMPNAPAAPEVSATYVPETAETRGNAALNLPDEFWESRDWLAHIRQAAHSRMTSADAVLGALITRFAAVIPPTYLIPPIVMTASTFDHLSILVGESSSGKSGAIGIARELFAGPPRKDIVWDIPVPSGEGLIQAFFEFVEETVDGKKTRVNKKTKTAVHFSVDEAMSLIEAGGRQGATIGSVLCTAWSGGNPGQSNATAERNRQGMNPHTYRMSGLAGIQTSLAHNLLSDTWVRQGLSGRLVFFAAEDPSIPDPLNLPPWPGDLDLPIPATLPQHPVEYADEIVSEVRWEHHRKQTGQVQEAPIDGHLRLVRLKLSGIMALLEGKDHVEYADWELAGMIINSHLAIRNRILAVQKYIQRDEGHKRAEAAAHFEDTRDSLKERRAIARLSDSIVAKVPEEGIARGALRKLTTSGGTRHRFDAALEQALERGQVIHRDDHYYPA